ncbi:dopamine beta-hydroxylase [Amia ocellicauda]|uniref:dopamine beta-hydroxylase n=1 Tax=Amia ocellicauda TaxID=2972642 RepID=UPI003464DDAF
MRNWQSTFSLREVTVMYFTMLATLVVILVASYQAASNLEDPFPYQMPLDPRGNLQLSWNISYPLQNLYFRLLVKDLRYGIMFGMSDRGEFQNADLAILWSDGYKSYFGDAWSDAHGHVRLDSQQDYQLVETHRAPEGFYILFKRPFSTCDSKDYVIEEGTVHLLYGTLDRPVTSLQMLNLSLTNTGVQRVQLLRPNIPAPSLPPDVKTLEVLSPSVTIPGQETTYWCHIVELPKNMPKNHIIMYESVITPGNEAIVHHIEVFECAPQFNSIPEYSGSCDSKMKPKTINYCRHVLAAWAMGAKAFYYPDEAGLSLGGPGSSRFLRLEVHYHNPLKIRGLLDSSGIRLYYTPTLRKYDAGIMELGLVYTPVMAIPPHEEHFELTGYCTAKCTRTALPWGGINIFASQLHTHLTGRSVQTVLVREGKEVVIVQEDSHFSTHYQIIRMLKKMVNVLPGDVLLTRCIYNTEDRDKATVGGFSIEDEMCVNYVHYFPRTQLELCKSHVDEDYLQKYFAFINRFQNKEACNCNQATVTEQFANIHWDTFSKEVLRSLYSTAPISMHCNQSSAIMFPGEWERQAIPRVTATLPKPHYLCETGSQSPEQLSTAIEVQT